MEQKLIRTSKKARKRNRAKKDLDSMARSAVFDRDGYMCVRCAKGPPERPVQWAHVIGRRHLCTRWESDNALTLCAGCHRWWHEYPSLSGPWFAKNWPERHERILELYNAGGKMNPVQLVEELRA